MGKKLTRIGEGINSFVYVRTATWSFVGLDAGVGGRWLHCFTPWQSHSDELNSGTGVLLALRFLPETRVGCRALIP